jgi:hypothetical protein
MQVTMTRKKNRRVYIYIPCIHRSVMAKLYWRVKRNGKWTWKAATVTGWTTDGYGGHIVEPCGGEMETGKLLEEEE